MRPLRCPPRGSNSRLGAALRRSWSISPRAAPSAILLRGFLLERHVEALRDVDGRRLHLRIEALQIAIDGLRGIDADRAVVLVSLDVLFQRRLVLRLVGVV